ncbi:MAG: hypothetical protein DI538_30775 [Azospira oryzae]|nr:MAG: hypothetical protein DI538_30775 [Azospira oryzae]
MISAPASWAQVDGPKPARRDMDVVVGLPDGEVRYCRAYAASMDAYGHALAVYPQATRITVTPVPHEVQP